MTWPTSRWSGAARKTSPSSRRSAALAGEHDELVETLTQNEAGTSSSWTPRRMPVLPVGDIANLAPNHAVVVSAAPAPPDRLSGVLAPRPGPCRAGRIGPAGRVEAPHSCLRGSSTVRRATFARW